MGRLLAIWALTGGLGLSVFTGPAWGAEAVTLNEENFDRAAALGEESDAIYGDYSISNDYLVAVVGNPELIGGRSASRSSPQRFDACVIDLTLRKGPGAGNDRLSWYAPGPRFGPHASDFQLGTANYQVDYAKGFKAQSGVRVSFTLHTVAWSYQQPPCAVRYTLEEGWRYLLCETIYINPADRPAGKQLIPVRPAPREDAEKLQEVADGPRDGVAGALPMPDEATPPPPAGPIRPEPGFDLRLDGVVEAGMDRADRLRWVYNRWQGQAYGVVEPRTWGLRHADGSVTEFDPARQADAKTAAVVRPGEELVVARKLIVGKDLFEVRAIASAEAGVALRRVKLVVAGPDGPVEGAVVTAWARPVEGQNAKNEPVEYASGVTDARGELEADLPDRGFCFEVKAIGRGAVKTDWASPQEKSQIQVTMTPAALAAVTITDESGGPIPCKIEFRGREGTPDPDFFPVTGDRAAGNLRYTETGRVTQVLPPGKYDVLVTRGPEYDLLAFPIEASPGKTASVSGRLVRVVDTAGWISADFHGYSTRSNKPSGSPPSAASALGRVLNLIGEGIEFSPTTELNKVETYEPLVEGLGAGRWFKTCPGIALNDGGRKYAFNEQYAWPIVYKPHWQDGGAPQRPQHCGQIEWLRSWGVPIDVNAPWASARLVGYEKCLILMQPDNLAPKELVRRPPVSTSFRDRDVAAWWNDESAHLRPMFRDTDGDGVPDHVHGNFASQMDALDVRTLAPLISPNDPKVRLENDIVDWMLMRQSGYRMTGVVNSGATTNFHGSGGVRNYVRSATDDPSKLDPLEVGRAVRAGKVVMTTGPFMDVKIEAPGGASAGPGEVLPAKGPVTLRVKIQCPNWISIDTVRVLRDNQRDEKLEFTRVSTPEKFGQGVVQFEQAIPLELQKDTQVMVVALGRGPNVRARKGPGDGKMAHVAVANPICVDLGGDGFVPQPPHLDRIEAELVLVRPLLSRAKSPPARVRLVVTNHADKPVQGVLTVQIKPTTIATIRGDGKFVYNLGPDKKMTAEFDVEMTDAAQGDALVGGIGPQSVMLSIARDGTPPGVAPARLQLIVDDSPRASVPNGPM